jgi:hypothetical protein
MDVKHFRDPLAAKNLAMLYKASRAIPFFGTGFTKDCGARAGRVPDAFALTKHITSAAAQKTGLSASEISQITGIANLKLAFELLTSEDYITKKQRQSLLGNLFSDVKLADKSKKEMLNLEWPHIFTFNIDDAIEEITRKFDVIRPNRPVSREYIASKKCLFKIHGDILEYLQYDDPNVIFTWREYAESIQTNEAMLSYLADQAKHTAFLFIGCSLDAEVDLLHIGARRQFKNSIFLKKGELTVPEKLTLKSYGITQVITFDQYNEIYDWVASTLRNEVCEAPLKDLTFEESFGAVDKAISIIANGGPLISEDSDGNRIGKKLSIFANREALDTAKSVLRNCQYLFVTGRRFSGKTLFLMQLINALATQTSYFYASSDVFNANVKRLIEGVENSVFFFDSNYLDVKALEAVLGWKTHYTNKFVFCSSFGDAEIFRFTFQKFTAKAMEISLSNKLTSDEAVLFNSELNGCALPNYTLNETLLNFSYKYYESYKSILNTSTIFGSPIDDAFFKIMILSSAFSKAQINHIKSLIPYFDVEDFLVHHDRLFEREVDVTVGEVFICNSSSWLISRVEEFISKEASRAIELVSDIIIGLSRRAFQDAAQRLITFDKLNELAGTTKTRYFIRGIFERVEGVFKDDSHYWLQRAKCELIMGDKVEAISDGIRFANKVRVENQVNKNQTYFSATLVLAQLCSRKYCFANETSTLLWLLDLYTESVDNYTSNKRHIDKVIRSYSDKRSDIFISLSALENTTDKELWVRKKDIQNLTSFFRINT